MQTSACKVDAQQQNISSQGLSPQDDHWYPNKADKLISNVSIGNGMGMSKIKD